MAKFEVGEIAVFAGTPAKSSPAMVPLIGTDVEIIGVVGNGTYDVIMADGDGAFVQEHSLRKKKPPEESKDITETRQKGAPSFTQLMQDMKREEMVK